MSGLKISIHADDLGLTKNISDGILDTFDNGALNSSSIIATGAAFEYAAGQAVARKGLNLALHINLVEGKPLQNSENISMLLNDRGVFGCSFQSLLIKHYFSSHAKRRQLEEQVKSEIIAQIEKFKNYFGNDINIKIDSHQHIHMVPFIFRIILELKSRYNIRFIRVPYEPFFIGYSYGAVMTLKNYFALNLVKHLLLNFLSLKNKKLLPETGIECNDYTIGILFSGNMSYSAVKAALKKIANKNKKNKNIHVELLFHPGGECNARALFSNDGVEFYDFYCSDMREREGSLLKDGSLEALLKKYL